MNTTRKSLHLVVHHRRDAHQPWPNKWLDDDRLEVITTTKEIGLRCAEALATGEPVRVHRCGWGDIEPSVCCEVSIVSSVQFDKRSYLVEFHDHKILADTPRVSPYPGQNSYQA